MVDDEIDVQEFLKMYLESLGWEVSIASSGAGALGELERRVYFLVVTDIAMPDMDGYDFISKIKEKRIDSQVVLMTGFGYNPQHTLIKINKNLRYPCLFKPFDRAKVAETVLKAWHVYNKVPVLSDTASPKGTRNPGKSDGTAKLPR